MTRVFDFSRQPPQSRSPWWRQLKLTPAMGVAVALLVAGIAGSLFLGGSSNSNALTEGSLRLNLNTATLPELESIRGIGASSIEKMRPYAKVDGEAEKLR